MDDETYCKEILAAYEGELGGAISAQTLIDHLAATGEHAIKLELLSKLETHVALALKPIIHRLNLVLADLGARARDRARSIRSWAEMLLAFGPQLEAYVRRFEYLLAAARPGDEAALTLLVEHERVLVEFGRLETAGDWAGALALLRRALP